MKSIIFKTFQGILLFFLIFSFNGCGNKNQTNIVYNMSGDELSKIILDEGKKDNILVIDVRSKSEYAQEHIINSINIPLNDLEKEIPSILDFKNKEVILYCNSGFRSSKGAKILVNNNFKHVSNAKGIKEFKYSITTK